MNIPRQQQMSPELDIKQTEPVICEKCKGTIFTDVLMLREVSALLTKSGQPGYIPIQVFSCIACNHVNKQFIPVELRTNIEV